MWNLTFRGTWDQEEPISVNELRTLTLLAKHLARSKKNWGRRFLVLADSIAALGAAADGPCTHLFVANSSAYLYAQDHSFCCVSSTSKAARQE